MFDYDPYCSAYPQYASQTLDWLPSDSQQLYNMHIKKDNAKSRKLKKLRFDSQNVKYKFNDYGFRCDNFKNNNNIVFLGCSLTLGIGINLENTFSQTIADTLNLNNCNLALAGGSNDAMFRIAYHWLPQLKPDIVVCYAPTKERSECFINNHHETLMASHPNNNRWYMNYLKEDNNFKINYQKNKLAIEHLCSQINTTLLFLHVEDWEFDYRKDLARDLMHPGVESHGLIAKQMLNQLGV